MESKEAKIHFLGREFDPRKVWLGGFFLAMAGIWASYAPSIGLPAIVAGLGLMGYSTHIMGDSKVK